tara:strand:- start:26 stop:559 length:534 start_codon:yes stop_codon:yes gene_type:complete
MNLANEFKENCKKALDKENKKRKEYGLPPNKGIEFHEHTIKVSKEYPFILALSTEITKRRKRITRSINKIKKCYKIINFDKDIYLVDLKELEKKYRELEHTFNPMEFSLKFGGKLNPCEQKIIKKIISWDKSNSPQINKQSSYLILIDNIEREHHKIMNNFVDFFNQLTSRKNKEIK